MPKKPGAKVKPNSLANLKLGRQPGHGRTLTYDQPKKKHGITITDEGWQGLETLAQQAKISVSELLERLGRGYVRLVSPDQVAADKCQAQPSQPTASDRPGGIAADAHQD